MSGVPAGTGQLVGQRLGKYEVVALLALGGTAEIYLAKDTLDDGNERYVVVKCLHDHLADDREFVRMFLDEARLAALLHHPNIVQAYDLGEHQHRYYMVLEFVAGHSLAVLVRKAEKLPGRRVPASVSLNMTAQSAAGLHYAHELKVDGQALNVVHRDISPQNLVIGFDGVAKVVDFGIAKAEMRETKTRAGTIKGKFAYMSPEQCVAHNVDRRTDVFALGVVLHEMLTGKRLFKRSSPYDTYQAVLDCQVPAPSSVNHELDPALDGLVLRALAKDPDLRYPTAKAFGDALSAYLQQRGKPSGPSEIVGIFKRYFPADLDEHDARMRELITGIGAMSSLDQAISASVNWDGELSVKQRLPNASDAEDDELAEVAIDFTKQPVQQIGMSGRATFGGSLGDRGPATDVLSDEELIASNAAHHGTGPTGDAAEDAFRSEDISAVLKHIAPTAELSSDFRRPRLDTQEPPTVPVDALLPDDDLPAERTQIEANPMADVAPPISTPAASPRFVASAPTIVHDESRPAPRAPEPAARLRPAMIPGVPISNPGAATIDAPDGVRRRAGGGAASAPDAAPFPSLPGMGISPTSPIPTPPSAGSPGGLPFLALGAAGLLTIGRAPAQPEVDDASASSRPPPLMAVSPVGPAYPQTDWAAAAAMRARAVPTWVLILCFVGAMAAAMLLTLLIARFLVG